jgi:hypothetical protein
MPTLVHPSLTYAHRSEYHVTHPTVSRRLDPRVRQRIFLGVFLPIRMDHTVFH